MWNDYTYISYYDLDTNQRDMWRCIASDDNDATSQFYDWCQENGIRGFIVDIG